MRLACALIIVPCALSPALADVSEETTYPYPGVKYLVRYDDVLPARLHVVEADLTSLELRLLATNEDERGQWTSTWAASVEADIAINGDLFDPLTFTPAGLALGTSGVAWSLSLDTATQGFLSFGRPMGLGTAQISPPEDLVESDALDPEVDGVVGGRPMLVRAGVPQAAFDCKDVLTLPCERAPRSAVGVSEDGHKLILIVVDGWQVGSMGLTLSELAWHLAERGAHDALALDPGSASALFIAGRGGLVSSPSDGIERPVANHIGIAYRMLTPGAMVGFVRERDIYSGASISGATVTLDSGERFTTGADGRYSFLDVSPRNACATAAHPGYHPVTSCRMVPSGGTVFNSVALRPNRDFVDGGPEEPDAGPKARDAGLRPDADASRRPDSGGGVLPSTPICACRIARPSEPPSATGLLIILWTVILRLRNPNFGRALARDVQRK